MGLYTAERGPGSQAMAVNTQQREFIQSEGKKRVMQRGTMIKIKTASSLNSNRRAMTRYMRAEKVKRIPHIVLILGIF